MTDAPRVIGPRAFYLRNGPQTMLPTNNLPSRPGWTPTRATQPDEPIQDPKVARQVGAEAFRKFAAATQPVQDPLEAQREQIARLGPTGAAALQVSQQEVRAQIQRMVQAGELRPEEVDQYVKSPEVQNWQLQRAGQYVSSPGFRDHVQGVVTGRLNTLGAASTALDVAGAGANAILPGWARFAASDIPRMVGEGFAGHQAATRQLTPEQAQAAAQASTQEPAPTNQSVAGAADVARTAYGVANTGAEAAPGLLAIGSGLNAGARAWQLGNEYGLSRPAQVATTVGAGVGFGAGTLGAMRLANSLAPAGIAAAPSASVALPSWAGSSRAGQLAGRAANAITQGTVPTVMADGTLATSAFPAVAKFSPLLARAAAGARALAIPGAVMGAAMAAGEGTYKGLSDDWQAGTAQEAARQRDTGGPSGWDVAKSVALSPLAPGQMSDYAYQAALRSGAMGWAGRNLETAGSYAPYVGGALAEYAGQGAQAWQRQADDASLDRSAQAQELAGQDPHRAWLARMLDPSDFGGDQAAYNNHLDSLAALGSQQVANRQWIRSRGAELGATGQHPPVQSAYEKRLISGGMPGVQPGTPLAGAMSSLGQVYGGGQVYTPGKTSYLTSPVNQQVWQNASKRWAASGKTPDFTPPTVPAVPTTPAK